MSLSIWIAIASIGVCVATVLNLRCAEKRINAYYERRQRQEMARLAALSPAQPVKEK